MARAKETSGWDKASEIWAVLAEVNRDKERREEPYTAATIHPYRTEMGDDVVEEVEPATQEEIRAAHEYASRMNRAMDAPDEIVEHVIRNV